ncbi:cytochrome P450 [Actinokineospora guangxiensis]|uniref:Cytochrome P450 n=1 Tax=Actinokineospora guangxiensis TaxID=1490288 RepID=A0ABW0EVA6_9PSEU
MSGEQRHDEDPASLSLYTRGHPHTVWRWLRNHDPVTGHHTADGTPYWSVVRYADAVKVLTDETTFTPEHGNMLQSIHGDIGRGSAINLCGGERHSVLRRIASPLMSAGVAASRAALVRPRVAAVLDSTLDGTVDFAVATRTLPMVVVGDLIGVPEKLWAEVSHWIMVSIAPADRFLSDDSSENNTARAHLELLSLFGSLARFRRKKPGEDLVSALVGAEHGGNRLTDDEVMLNAYTFAMGAGITTPHVVNHLVWLLSERPELLDLLSGAEDVAPFVAESLRWASPTNHVLRRAAKPVELGGRQVRAGDFVCVWTGSANRDEEVYEDPFVFAPRSSARPSLSFGFGPHYCMGAHLARVGLRIFIEEFRAKVRGVTPGGPVRHLASNFINGVTSLPVHVQRR